MHMVCAAGGRGLYSHSDLKLSPPHFSKLEWLDVHLSPGLREAAVQSEDHLCATSINDAQINDAQINDDQINDSQLQSRMAV